MEETGVVIELKSPQVALVLCQRTGACDHCATKASCISSGTTGEMRVEAHNGLGAKVGDRVRIATSSALFLRSSFVLYIIPVVALVIGAAAGQLIGARLTDGPDPNLLAAIIGFAFLVGSFLIVRIGTRALPPENYMPTITAILSPEEDPVEGQAHEH